MTNGTIKDIQHWVNDQMIRGRYIFTKEDVLSLGLSISQHAVKNSLSRLISKGEVMSPWQNFFVIVPTQYRLKGVVPPSFYIDRLMRFLGRNYYVSLLSAASLNGASHQRAMTFQVTTDGNALRSGEKSGTVLEFTNRRQLPMDFVNQVKTQLGYMNVSGPELTALDLVANEQKVGGLSRVAEVLTELSEALSWSEEKKPLLTYFNAPVIQRLGYLLDAIEETTVADVLFNLAHGVGRPWRKVALKQTASISDEMPSDNRWRIIENYTLEIDEI